MIARFVNTGGIVDNHCLNFFFINVFYFFDSNSIQEFNHTIIDVLVNSVLLLHLA